jgi:hypothetical protein
MSEANSGPSGASGSPRRRGRVKRKTKLATFDDWVFDRENDILVLSLRLPGAKKAGFWAWVQHWMEVGLTFEGIDPKTGEKTKNDN